MLSKYKESFLPIVSIVARPFMSVHPNTISIIGFLFSVVFALLLIGGHVWWAVLSFVGVLFDTLDGYIARTTGRASAFGGFLDSTLDRAADFVIINAFAFAGLVAWEITITLSLLGFLVSYTRSRAELAGKGKFVLDVGIIERTERLLFILVLLIVQTAFELGELVGGYNFLELGFLVLILLSFFTVLQRVHRAYKLLK
ncbi:CDP-alcohol phosphatidyltransferase family protein [Patescibacteria group bacterium]